MTGGMQYLAREDVQRNPVRSAIISPNSRRRRERSIRPLNPDHGISTRGCGTASPSVPTSFRSFAPSGIGIWLTDVPSKRSDPVTQANDDYPSGCHQACLLSRASAGKECRRSHQLVENQCCCRKGSHDWFGWLLLKSPWALLGRADLEIILRRQCSERPHIANFIREWANSRNFIRAILL